MPNRPDRLRREVAELVRRRLRDGTWPAGTLLPAEAALADEAGVSRWTVRLALGRAADEGLVRRLPGRGWRAGPGTDTAGAIAIGGTGHDRAMDGLRNGAHAVAAAHGLRITSSGRTAPLPQPGVSACVWFDQHGPDPMVVAAWHEAGLPFIAAGCGEHLPCTAITPDYRDGSRRLVEHAWRLGHRRIAFVGTAALHRSNPAFVARVEGYRAAMAAHGLETQVALLPSDFDRHSHCDRAFAQWFASVSGGRLRPTCLYLSGPRFATRVAAVLARIGLQVPGDVGLAGFGDSLDATTGAAARFRRFTRLFEPWHALGEAAARSILAQRLLPGPHAQVVSVAMTLDPGDSLIARDPGPDD